MVLSPVVVGFERVKIEKPDVKDKISSLNDINAGGMIKLDPWIKENRWYCNIVMNENDAKSVCVWNERDVSASSYVSCCSFDVLCFCPPGPNEDWDAPRRTS